MYILGKTETGKSTLIANMIASDIARNHGLALIDPHGDLAESVLDLVPERKVNDVIYFNPADLDMPIAFNPLEKVDPDKSHLVTSGLISTFKKIWSEFWGPRMEHILRYSILALLEYPESTLLDIALILTDKGFRAKVLGWELHHRYCSPGSRERAPGFRCDVIDFGSLYPAQSGRYYRRPPSQELNRVAVAVVDSNLYNGFAV